MLATEQSIAEYLAAVGICNICIVSDAGRFSFSVARNVIGIGMPVVSVHWVDSRPRAIVAARDAQRIAGANASELGAIAALGSAAILHDLKLTPHAIVMARARVAVGKLDAAIRAAENDGRLAIFNSEFQRRRLASRDGFMSYATARKRLRVAIVRRLIRHPAGDSTATNSMGEFLSEVFGGTTAEVIRFPRHSA